MKAKKIKLKVYELRYIRESRGWMLFGENSCMVWPYIDNTTKEAALAQAVSDMEDFKEMGQFSELHICNKNGRYSPARTYGPDPRKSRG